MQEHVQVDSSKCKACRRCEFACIASHHGLDIKTAMKMKDTYSPRCWAHKGDSFKTSVRCHGCNPAPCCTICPTGALEQNADGSFSMHPELCAGCMMCVSVCPYGVISEEHIKKIPDTLSQDDKTAIAVRCDLCAEWRAEKGVEYTACMEACTTRALVLVKSDGTIVEAPKVEKKPKPAPAVEAKPEPAPEKVVVEAKAAPKADAEVVVEAAPAPKAEVKPEPKAEAAPAPKPEAKPEPKAEAKVVVTKKPEKAQDNDEKKKKGKKKK
ncbi:MAG: 4Fe-4S binding protein [Desulfovibrio sp.]|nr:4Fe-4S binding protein [Desulfovibrio sp.]